MARPPMWDLSRPPLRSSKIPTNGEPCEAPDLLACPPRWGNGRLPRRMRPPRGVGAASSAGRGEGGGGRKRPKISSDRLCALAGAWHRRWFRACTTPAEGHSQRPDGAALGTLRFKIILPSIVPSTGENIGIGEIILTCSWRCRRPAVPSALSPQSCREPAQTDGERRRLLVLYHTHIY